MVFVIPAIDGELVIANVLLPVPYVAVIVSEIATPEVVVKDTAEAVREMAGFTVTVKARKAVAVSESVTVIVSL